jgi:two-component system sensor histidine kinase ArlS
MRLRRKIYLYSSVLFAALSLLANITIYWAFSRESIKQELAQIEAETQRAAFAIRDIADTTALQELLRAYVPINGMIALVTDGVAAPRIVTSASQTQLNRLTLTFSPKQTTELIIVDGRNYGFVTIPYIRQDGEVANVQAVVSLDELMELLLILRFVLIAVTIAALIPALVSSGILGRVIMQPIAAMTRTMNEITRSGKFVKLDQGNASKDELAEMGEAFNEMIELLETNYKKQEQFVSNASHELKTPLTIIESYASLLKRRGIERPELFVESIEAIHSEAVRMRVMTEQLLLLARPDRQPDVTVTEVDLAELAAHTASSFRKAYMREVLVATEADAPLLVKTDEDKVKQLLYIMLDNARKYSKELIKIEVGAESDGSNHYIRVIDRGIGIPKQELGHVFERFYRVDKARSRDKLESEGGMGLGLSLAREIAGTISVRIEIDSKEGIGTTAIIHIPPYGSQQILMKPE